jgi:predicted thioredoxin/glutaredoxin
LPVSSLFVASKVTGVCRNNFTNNGLFAKKVFQAEKMVFAYLATYVFGVPYLQSDIQVVSTGIYDSFKLENIIIAAPGVMFKVKTSALFSVFMLEVQNA